MRTKTILLSGVVAALSGASLMAQVYSLNVVGYINVTVPPNFSMIADQLYSVNQSTAQYISPLLDSQLLDGAHNGVELFKYSNANGYTILIANSTGWQGPATTTTLYPGEAVFIYNPFTTNLTLTFVGQVPQGSLTNALFQNFNLVSSIVPQSGALDDPAGAALVPNAGDEIFLYDSVNGYQIYIASGTTGVWQKPASLPASPTPAVGQGFFYYTSKAAGVTWTRTFSVI
jgi:hypothetical protein